MRFSSPFATLVIIHPRLESAVIFYRASAVEYRPPAKRAMIKAEILQMIKRTAESNGGIPLGRDRFETETGITKSDWYGVHWARWSDAVREAGFAPNQLQVPVKKETLLKAYSSLAQELGKLPTDADLNFKCKNTPDFPGRTTFAARLGVKADLVKQLIEYCQEHGGYEDALAMCAAYSPPARNGSDDAPDNVQIGFVYLLKHGTRRE